MDMAAHKFIPHPDDRLCVICGHTYGSGEHFHTDPARVDKLIAEIDEFLAEFGQQSEQ